MPAQAIDNETRRADTPIEFNVTIVNPDTEYSQVIPIEAKSVLIKTRDQSEFRFSFVTGKVAGPTAPYITVNSSKSLAVSGLKLDAAMTVYFGSAEAGKIVEIIVLH